MHENRETPIGNSEEIQFVPLVRELWHGRLLILSTAVVFILLAIAYVFIKKPLYEAKAYLQPPSVNDVASLNEGRGQGTGLELLDVNEVYAVYLRNLQSGLMREKFFREIYIPAIQRAGDSVANSDVDAVFNNLLSIGLADKSVPTRYLVALRARQPDVARDWVQRYVEMASEFAKQEVLNGVLSDASFKANDLQRQIDIARESAKEQRKDKIVQLKESLRIAHSLGLQKPTVTLGGLSQGLSSDVSGVLDYLRGSEALEAEIESLESRTSDDYYISSLRKMQADLTFYQKLRIHPESIQVFRLDGGVMVPVKPLGRRVELVLVAAGLLGILVGISLVFGRKHWKEVVGG